MEVVKILPYLFWFFPFLGITTDRVVNDVISLQMYVWARTFFVEC